MIFETLYEAAQHHELILVDNGMCHYHIRKDRQITIHEIIVLPQHQHQGIGKKMLHTLKTLPALSNATSIFAKCPTDLQANTWYKNTGFKLENTTTTRTGREMNHWRLQL